MSYALIPLLSAVELGPYAAVLQVNKAVLDDLKAWRDIAKAVPYAATVTFYRPFSADITCVSYSEEYNWELANAADSDKILLVDEKPSTLMVEDALNWQVVVEADGLVYFTCDIDGCAPATTSVGLNLDTLEATL